MPEVMFFFCFWGCCDLSAPSLALRYEWGWKRSEQSHENPENKLYNHLSPTSYPTVKDICCLSQWFWAITRLLYVPTCSPISAIQSQSSKITQQLQLHQKFIQSQPASLQVAPNLSTHWSSLLHQWASVSFNNWHPVHWWTVSWCIGGMQVLMCNKNSLALVLTIGPTNHSFKIVLIML